jgi:hypothetical protein
LLTGGACSHASRNSVAAPAAAFNPSDAETSNEKGFERRRRLRVLWRSSPAPNQHRRDDGRSQEITDQNDGAQGQRQRQHEETHDAADNQKERDYHDEPIHGAGVCATGWRAPSVGLPAGLRLAKVNALFTAVYSTEV